MTAPDYTPPDFSAPPPPNTGWINFALVILILFGVATWKAAVVGFI